MKVRRPVRVCIIGAGASGLAAAVAAARAGACTTVLEHNTEAGIKLLLTGNSKCNLSNTDMSASHYHGTEEFIESVLKAFDICAVSSFFESIGIKTVTVPNRFDNTGYIYPASGNARDVRDALFREAIRLGTDFRFGVFPENAIRNEHGGFTVTAGGNAEEYDSLILAAGSNAYPATGSDGSVYPLIKQLGISFRTFLPALCPLYSKNEALRTLAGIRCNGRVSVMIDGKNMGHSFGEIQFNEHSISGIPVFQISYLAAPALKENRRVVLQTYMEPDRENINANRKLEVYLKNNGKLKYEFEINRTGGFERSQTCTGGVPAETIDPCTMASGECRNVYLCGELIDIDGECGGYNLHFAWATGTAAGRNAAECRGSSGLCATPGKG